MYKSKLADMTTDYRQLQADLIEKEEKIEALSKEILKLQSDLEDGRQTMFRDDSSDFENDIFRRVNTGSNTKEMMRKVENLLLKSYY